MPQTVEQYLSQFPPVGTISARTPTARERQTTGFQNMLFSDDREGAAKANRLMNVLDYTGANVPAMGYDLGAAAGQGDIGSLALTAGIGMLPAVGRKLKSNNIKSFLSDMSGMFMGPKAKNADLPALSAAQLLKEQGVPREEILSKTGWFQQKDGKWRFEVPSNEADFTRPTKYLSPLKDVYSHPNLYENYPELRTMKVRSAMDIPGSGAYDPTGKELSMSALPGSSAGTSVMNHEVQHAIQDIEGWAPGTGTSELLSKAPGTPANQLYKSKLAEFVQRTGKAPSTLEQFSLARQSASEGYERSAGEIEARNTQWRAKYGYAKPPWETQDVPEDKILVDKQSSGLSGLLSKLRGK